MINGLYKTADDFPEIQNKMSKLLSIKDNINDNRIKSITFVVTEQCNLRCTYCYQHNKNNKKMDINTAKQAVDFILDAHKVNEYYNTNISKGVILDFIGGEPLLEIDVIDFIVDYFKKRTFELSHPWFENYFINITTNGTLYDNDKVLKFLNKNKGRVSVGITIDGNKELHDSCRIFPDGTGSYDVVEKNVKKWIELEESPQTKITLCPNNIKYTSEAIKSVFNLGIRCASTNCVFEKGWTIEHARILFKEMKKLGDYILDNDMYKKYYCSLFDEYIGDIEKNNSNYCGGNGDMLAISPDGKLYPCIRFMKYSLKYQQEKSIGDIWNGINTKDRWLIRLKNIDRESQIVFDDNKKCQKCKISSGCSHCTGYNYDYFGDPNHKATFICDMHKARVLANVYFWNKLYNKLSLNKRFICNVSKEDALRIIDEMEYKQLKEMEMINNG